jgi:hypothetical protein
MMTSISGPSKSMATRKWTTSSKISAWKSRHSPKAAVYAAAFLD